MVEEEIQAFDKRMESVLVEMGVSTSEDELVKEIFLVPSTSQSLLNELGMVLSHSPSDYEGLNKGEVCFINSMEELYFNKSMNPFFCY